MTPQQELSDLNVIEYFARVLRRGQLDEVTFGEDKFVTIPRAHLRTGQLPPDEVEKLFARRRDDSPVPVVISLLSLQLSGGRHAGLVLLSALLRRDGQLEAVVETASSPWIPAERLNSPQVTGRQVMLGEQETFWKSFHGPLSAEVSQVESFADAVDLADALCKEVSGLTPEEFAEQRTSGRTVLDAQTCYVMEFERINATRNLLELYDHLLRTQELGLVSQLIGGGHSPVHERDIHREDGLLARALDASGSMSDGFPLTASQRRAVHGFLTDGANDVTAVSGPPGTGKTTMLQAVVATLLTNYALREQAPPLIVGMSTNNQAVTNIIDAFGSVTKKSPGRLDHRWLPVAEEGAAGEAAMTSLAVYCPSGTKRQAAQGRYLLEDHRKEGIYSEYSSPEYLSGARDCYAAKAFSYFGHTSDIPGLKKMIHEALVEVDDLRTELLRHMASHGPDAGYSALCAAAAENPHLKGLSRIEGLSQCTDLVGLDKELDRTLRYAEFWLAVHYYEACWLEAEFIPVDERWKRTQSVMEAYWQQAAALTPCFVMTAYQVPRYFSLYTKKDEPVPFDIGRIDLMIVDEAGQVDTAVGAAPFALAQRALVVGDTQQLAPVWSLDVQTDQEVAASAGIELAVWEELLQPHGLTCSQPSSLMASAAHSGRWLHGDDAPRRGLFLAEHFRCHPSIIGLCNDLLYGGLLNPQRKETDSKLHGLTEAFQFRPVPGSSDTQVGTSRKNVPEAEAIAQWVIDNYDILHDVYIDQIDDPNKKAKPDGIIGVVTPFSAQARTVREVLQKRLRDLPSGSLIPANLASAMTIGTAHQLQGAERPVILFSAVYGDAAGEAGFIDANPELLNVAVSRAKDLLVMFGAERRWNHGSAFRLVAKHASKTDANIGSGPVPDPSEGLGLAANAPAGLGVQPPALPAGPPADSVRADDDVRSTQRGGASRLAPADAAPASPSEVEGALTVSQLIARWRDMGELRPEDSKIKATELNARLAKAGFLEGEPGAWRVTMAGELAGVGTERRTKADGTSYEVIQYEPRALKGLQEMYREGRL
ncbi:AAA family ATPase [Kytococcus sedentarius]|nr:AAA domain-containing protein [Kytococcus sedentarius]QQB63239.1 AAA family ATPase [Kytococcus sedentarius]STX13891.1 putative DNA helicase [Kytococcus sedentarius]